MRVEFTKMHGLGNDFVIFDGVTRRLSLTPERVRAIADRRFGVGCDQVLLVESSEKLGVHFRYRIFNADGGEVAQCGNGARCFARFVRDRQLTDQDEIIVETAFGVIQLYLQVDGQVRVNMGAPRFEPRELPFQAERECDNYVLELDGGSVTIGAVSMGNPHAVLQVEDVEGAPVARLGPAIEAHPRFPERVNVGFMQILARDRIRLRVYERGAGETLACGSGACAAVAVGRRWGLLDEQVKVDLPGGRLLIHWEGDAEPVWMTGPVATVFEGNIEL